VRRPRVTVNASVLAAALRIDASFKSDVMTVIAGDDCFGAVAKKFRSSRRPILIKGCEIVRFELDMKFFESTCRIARRSTTVDLHVVWVGLVLSVFTVEFFTGLEIMFRHQLSSHEHIALSNGFLPHPDTPTRRYALTFGMYLADQYDGGKIVSLMK
jgi:hypothetical protein